VVVFKYPQEPERDFIKRVIGLPGERVEIRGRQVLVNDVPLEEPYVHFLERGGVGAELGPGFEPEREHWGPKVVPPGQLLVLGDNRNNSSDGRYWGFLPVDQVKGRALMVYWSYEATKEEYNRRGLWNWLLDTLSAFGRTRWERFFHLIR
jgi:signal peptidase I